jgi:polar amino acid transport system substrate-binding protein
MKLAVARPGAAAEGCENIAPGSILWNNRRMRLKLPVLEAGIICVSMFVSGFLNEPASAADNMPVFAPTGTLRATYLGSNPVQARTDPKTGEVTGPVVDLTKELARRLGVPYKIIPSPDARAVMDSLKNHTADVGFLAYDAPRAAEVDYAGPFEVMFNSYVVGAKSAIQKTADVEKTGIVVGAVKGQTQEIYLSDHLKNAKLRTFSNQPAVPEMERMLTAGELNAFAMNRQSAVEIGAASASLRVLPDSFLEVEQEFVLEKGSDAAKLAYLNQLADELRASGFLKSSIERAKLTGADVPPRE